MKLPDGDKAIVDLVKLRDYCLNPRHRTGRNKARVFASALGITQQEADFLAAQIRTAARDGEAVAGVEDEYGSRYIVDFAVAHGDRRAVVRSTWIVLKGETTPRLTSCYVL